MDKRYNIFLIRELKCLYVVTFILAHDKFDAETNKIIYINLFTVKTTETDINREIFSGS